MKKLLIIAGSKSDESLAQKGFVLCDALKIEYDFRIFSAHRNLDELLEFLKEVEKDDKTQAIICIAGLSAALPGVVASKVEIPVIGVPVECGALRGVDALLSIVQMPKGVPVATMAIGIPGMLNAVHFAKRIFDLKGEKNG